jgi:hypothetical protein
VYGTAGLFLRQRLNEDSRLHNIPDVVNLLVTALFVAAVSASAGTQILIWDGNIRRADFAHAAFNWWVGDAVALSISRFCCRLFCRACGDTSAWAKPSHNQSAFIRRSSLEFPGDDWSCGSAHGFIRSGLRELLRSQRLSVRPILPADHLGFHAPRVARRRHWFAASGHWVGGDDARHFGRERGIGPEEECLICEAFRRGHGTFADDEVF